MILKFWLRFLAVLTLCLGLVATPSNSLAIVHYDGQRSVSIPCNIHFSDAIVGFDGAKIQSANKNRHQSVQPNALFAAFSKLLAAEDAVAARQSVARQFYQDAGWSNERIANHLQGIDFNQPVDVVRVPQGSQVVQHQIPGSPVGNYFAPVGTPANGLGIYTSGRVGTIFTATEDTTVLRSTASSVNNTWEVPGWNIQAPGGNTQLFSPNPGAFNPNP